MYINASLHWLYIVTYRRKHFCLVQREELWLAGCEWHFPHTAQHSITQGRPVAEPQPRLCGVCARFGAVHAARESGEGWLSGERHTGPSLGLAVWRCVLQLAKRQTVWALAVNICSRDCTICPKARGEHLCRLRPAAEPQTWTWAVLQRQRTRPRHSQSRRVLLEHLSHTLSCVLSAGCNHREV